MATGNNHLLQKVTFEIGLASQDGAFEIQNRISSVFQSQVLASLENLFDRKTIPGMVISIDKIEINLGTINSSRIEVELVSAFEREFDNFLATLNEEIRQTEITSNAASRKVNFRWSVPGNVHFETEVTLSNNSASHYEKVLRLLEFGILPSSGTELESQSIGELIHVVLEKHPEEFIRFLRMNRSKTQIYHRLALNVSAPQLQYIISLLGCGFSAQLPAIVKEMSAFFRDQKVETAKFVRAGNPAFSEPQKFIWWVILLKYLGLQQSVPSNPGEITGTTFQFADNSAQAEVRLIAEILFIAERLSERSILTTIGIASLKNKFSANLIAGINVVKKEFQDIETTESSTTSDSPVSYPVEQPAGRSILSDSVSLLHNTLFTVPVSQQNEKPFSTITNEEVPAVDTGIFINNAGLVLLGPYIRPLFSRLGLLEGKEFVSEEAKYKGVHLLQHACGFTNENPETAKSEHALIFNKILCGIPIPEAVPEELDLTEEEKNEVDSLLKAVLANWTIMSRSSVYALQSTFLQKKGRLTLSDKNWNLLVERDSAVEILIDKLPWGISMLKLPWNEYCVYTQW